MEWKTVAIPFAAGIRPSSQARLLDQGQLLEAVNVSYSRDNGPQKRRGHVSRVVRTSASLIGSANLEASGDHETYSLANPDFPARWLHGWGIVTGTDIPVGPSTADFDDVSEHPEAGLLFGQFARDNEVVAWDGHRVFSYAPEQPELFGEAAQTSNAVMPTMRATSFAKKNGAQLLPDFADNGVVMTAAWIDSAASNTSVSWQTLDSATQAVLSNKSESFTTPGTVRVICVGPWTHILVSDSNTHELYMRSFHQDSPTEITNRSLGVTRPQFDVKKLNETRFATATFDDGAIFVNIYTAAGTHSTGFLVNTTGITSNSVAIAFHGDNQIGIAWLDNPGLTAYFRLYNTSGVALTDRKTVAVVNSTCRITLSDHWLDDADGFSCWTIFLEDYHAGVSTLNTYLVRGDALDVDAGVTRERMTLASQAFRVGERTYVWGGVKTALQSTWYLLDQGLLPVGKLDFGLANVDIGTSTTYLPSVNWTTTDIYHSDKDRVVFHGCLSYRQRVETSASTPQPNGVFAEQSIRSYKLDFLPRLRTAQAGRTTYIAGAQLWAYDGFKTTEACFHMAPEGTIFTPSTGGSLTASGKYRYRIDLCRKNGQNEEIRSWSIISEEISMGALDTKITLAIPNVPVTRASDSYFLIFRTPSTGTSYYLVSSRDPSTAGPDNGYVANSFTGSVFSFVDVLADTSIVSRESHPGNAGNNYLEPLPAPACEVIAAGRDRLWLAGGELAPGELAPSRYFAIGETPSFTPALNIQVDRGIEPITAMGFMGDLAVIFRTTSTYILDSDGPDNVLSQSRAWVPPRLALADVGAVSQDCLALCTQGLFFQSLAGLRLLAPGGASQSTGSEVDPIASVGSYSAAVVEPVLKQIRFYSRDNRPSLVYHYDDNKWVTWTGVECVGATCWIPGRKCVLSRRDGIMWAEEDDVFLDDGRKFEFRVRTAWLHAGDLGDFQRFRRFALFGQVVGPVTLRTRIFYDERPFHSQELTIDIPENPNGSSWGGALWGSGTWGDSDNVNGQAGLWFKDGVFRYRKMPNRQKCSVFSLEFSDTGASTSSIIPVALALELGIKEGLDRIPN